MKTLWENIPCDHKVQKIEATGWTDYVHNYDFGVMDIDEAANRFSRFSFEAKKVMKKIKDGVYIGYGFTGGQQDQLNFTAVREGDMVHVTMNEKKCVYKKIR